MISEVKKINLRDGEVLHLDIVENGSPVWLIVTHGLGEHGERHQYMHHLFSQYFNICIYDLRGHGKSTGKRAYVDSFSEYNADLGELIEYLKEDYGLKRYVLFGHSMGGLIVSSFMQNNVTQDCYPEKVFLSNPAGAGAGLAGEFFKLVPTGMMEYLRAMPVSVPLEGLIDIKKLSHDPRVYENYINDPLNILKVHTKLFMEILTEGKKVFSRPLRVSCDLFCSVAMADAIVDYETTVKYFMTLEKNCKLFKVEGGYHELHNEIEKYREPHFEFLKQSIMDSIIS